MFPHVSECTKEKHVLCIHYCTLIDFRLNLENDTGLGGFSVLFWYEITLSQTGQEEMKEKDILLT